MHSIACNCYVIIVIVIVIVIVIRQSYWSHMCTHAHTHTGTHTHTHTHAHTHTHLTGRRFWSLFLQAPQASPPPQWPQFLQLGHQLLHLQFNTQLPGQQTPYIASNLLSWSHDSDLLRWSHVYRDLLSWSHVLQWFTELILHFTAIYWVDPCNIEI